MFYILKKINGYKECCGIMHTQQTGSVKNKNRKDY